MNKYIFSFLLCFIKAIYTVDYNEYLIQGAIKGDFKAVKDALDSGANIKARDNSYATALLYAVDAEAFDLVKFLLERGAEVNIIDGFKRNPLILSIDKENARLVRLLLAQANINIFPSALELVKKRYDKFRRYATLYQKDLKNLLKRLKSYKQKFSWAKQALKYHTLGKALSKEGIKHLNNFELYKRKVKKYLRKIKKNKQLQEKNNLRLNNIKLIGRMLINQLGLYTHASGISRQGIIGAHGIPAEIACKIATYVNN